MTCGRGKLRPRFVRSSPHPPAPHAPAAGPAALVVAAPGALALLKHARVLGLRLRVAGRVVRARRPRRHRALAALLREEARGGRKGRGTRGVGASTAPWAAHRRRVGLSLVWLQRSHAYASRLAPLLLSVWPNTAHPSSSQASL